MAIFEDLFGLLHDRTVFLCVSGGRDSTAMALMLAAQPESKDMDIRLLFGDTRLNSPRARKVVKRLSEENNWPLEVARYEGEERVVDILRRSFEVIPKAIERKDYHRSGKSKSYKTLFPCCDVLKKRPMRDFVKKLDKSKTVQLLGIKGGDKALHRWYRMKQLRENNTYWRLKKDGWLYYYPLRDYSDAQVQEVLEQYDYGDVTSSGCVVCPIFCVADWEKKSPETTRRSKLMAQRFGVDLRAENQLPLGVFCSEFYDHSANSPNLQSDTSTEVIKK